MLPTSPKITNEILVRNWLKAVQENSQGAAESAVIFTHLSKSRKNIKTPLWEIPPIKTVVEKVKAMVKESRFFDPNLAQEATEAIAFFCPQK